MRSTRLGLSEVARIRAEMDKIIAEVEFEGDFEAFTEASSVPIHASITKILRQLLSGYQGHLQESRCDASQIVWQDYPGHLTGFARSPISRLHVPPPPTTDPRSADGSQPGWFYANTLRSEASRPIYEMEALASA